ncbi:MAG: hypothetical protein Q7J98_14435 [Kiritimatiellia bacterium]|nr:hypothetical protein [Kiritimatiellia bacterium]
MSIGSGAGSRGVYNLTAGQLAPIQVLVGVNGEGIFNHSGGTNTCTNGLSVGHIYKGTYNLTGGELRMQNDANKRLIVGQSAPGDGTFNLGDANTSGTITEFGTATPYGVYLQVVGDGGTGKGTFRGWGSVQLTHYLIMSGRTIADGYGTDRTLDFSTMRGISQPYDNTTTNGWYAQNHGKLRLPGINVSGSATYYWGENGDLDLVNAVRLVINGTGTLVGELRATDCVDVPVAMRAIGVWNFSGVTGSTGTLTFRYDHIQAPARGIAESDLKVFRHDGAGWVNVTAGAVDTVNKYITTSAAVNPVGWFAVGKKIDRGTIFRIH